MKEGPGNEASVGALQGEPGGRAPLLETLKIYKGRLWRQASLSIGAPIGNLEGKFIYWGFRETVKDGSGNNMALSTEDLQGEPEVGGSFTGNSES